MRYPNIIFFRYDKYNDVDKIINANKDKYLFNVNIINNVNGLYKLFNSRKF